jgi:hypothetical protein
MSQINIVINQLSAEINDYVNVLRRDATKSTKLSYNIQMVIFDLAYHAEKAIEMGNLGRAYDLITDIANISREFHDYDVIRDTEKIRAKILQLVELNREM